MITSVFGADFENLDCLKYCSFILFLTGGRYEG